MSYKDWIKYPLLFILEALIVNLVVNVFINSVLTAIGKMGPGLSLQSLLLYKITRDQILPRVLGTLLVFAFTLYKMKRVHLKAIRLNQNEYGSARFSTLKEIKNQYKEIDATTSSYSGHGGALVARHRDKLYIDDDTVNTMILGMTRSGKGELYVLPLIDILSRSEEKPSMVINDMKGELVTISEKTLKNRGYDVHIFNLIDPSLSMRVNLLEPVIRAWREGDRDEAQVIVKSITHTIFPAHESGDDAYWRDGAVSLTNAFIFACLEYFNNSEFEHKLTLPEIALEMQSISAQQHGFDLFFGNLADKHPGKVEAGTFLSGTDKQRGTFLSIATSKLRNFTLDKFQKMMSSSTLNFETIGFSQTPQAVFLVIPDYDSSNHFIASLVIRQIYDSNIKKASKSTGQRTNRRIHFIFDEFGNMPPLSDMGAVVTAGLSRGLFFHLVIQDFEQLKSKYPKEATTIRANCGNLLYILSKDPETLEYISKSCGSITTQTYSGSEVKSDRNISIIERPLISTDELRQLKLWESIFIRSSKRSDLKGQAITAYPIDNRSVTKLVPRFMYLSSDFSSENAPSLEELAYEKYKSQMNKFENTKARVTEKIVGF